MAHRQLSAAEATNQPVQQAKPMLASSHLAFPSFPLFLFFHCLLLISPFPFLLSFPFSSFSSSIFFPLEDAGLLWGVSFSTLSYHIDVFKAFQPYPTHMPRRGQCFVPLCPYVVHESHFLAYAPWTFIAVNNTVTRYHHCGLKPLLFLDSQHLAFFLQTRNAPKYSSFLEKGSQHSNIYSSQI